MGHPSGLERPENDHVLGDATRTHGSNPARSSQRSGIRFPAPRFSPHRVLGSFRPFAHSPFRLPPLLPFSDLLLPFTSIDDEGVVIAIESPWTRGNLRGFQKFPVGCVCWLQMQIITYRR
jgi:hypothetical protein